VSVRPKGPLIVRMFGASVRSMSTFQVVGTVTTTGARTRQLVVIVLLVCV
jgi:hypothetical protein